jgi:phosphate acetyltransferase
MEREPTRSNERYERLLHYAQTLPPVTTAVAHPCDEVSLKAAVEAARLGLIAPILVGPPDRVRDVAERMGSISGFPQPPGSRHDPPRKLARALPARAGRGLDGVACTDELMGAVVARTAASAWRAASATAL